LVSRRPRLLFLSPRYLLPADTGAKIRTTDILRGLKGGRFEVILVGPGPGPADLDDPLAIAELCDRFVSWPAPARGAVYQARRVTQLLSPLPIAVACERSVQGRRVITDALNQSPDVVLVDFPHTAVNLPSQIKRPSVVFTHNIEAEIYGRHAAVATSALWRWIWREQRRKMETFERTTLARFDDVIAVSERDGEFFKKHFGVAHVSIIPTGVDLRKLSYEPPRPNGDRPANVVFVGSMDWLPNIDGMEFFMDAVWPAICQANPRARMTVVGRTPPERLVQEARARGYDWRFTGFVDDVRPYVREADVAVIPLRIGGGTRMKAYESMALGAPVVSTTIGVEGLPVEPGTHYERADDPGDFARSVLRLLSDAPRREELARSARALVEANFSSQRVAAVFETICLETLDKAKMRNPA
jgi:glycosyltransferase involved in cell wall biosynthesis